MLVDLKLKTIAEEYGALSPELAVGFRSARAARGHFDDLDNVTASVWNSTAAAIAVRKMMVKEKAVFAHDHGRHVYVFCHLPTGSVLRLELLPGILSLPPCCSAAENALLAGREVRGRVILAYHAQVDALVERLLTLPLEEVFSVRRYRCRPAARPVDELCRFLRCERCGAEVRLNRLYDAEGFRLCTSCAGVEPSWFGAAVGARSGKPDGGTEEG